MEEEPIEELFEGKKIVIEEEQEKDKKFILILLILLFCLLFLGLAVGIALFGSKMSSPANVINVGTVLFSYNEGSNSIEILGALPTSDEVGKNLSGEKEYFDFVIAIGFHKSNKKEITYEISAVPDKTNTLDERYVRMNLKENGKDFLINNKDVNLFSSLSKSTIRDNARVLLKKTVNKYTKNNYVFRMWVAEDYQIDGTQRVFRCVIMMDAY